MTVSVLGFDVEALACPWTSALECAMASERGAAGTSDYVRACSQHQPQVGSGPLPLDAFLAVARLEGDYLEAATCPACGRSTEGSEEWSDGLCDDCHLAAGEEDPDRAHDDRVLD
jgi:hypothetical protein